MGVTSVNADVHLKEMVGKMALVVQVCSLCFCFAISFLYSHNIFCANLCPFTFFRCCYHHRPNLAHRSAVRPVMLTDVDECATQSRCGGGTCKNIVAKETSDKGFSCTCFPGFRTFLQDQYCSGESLGDMVTQKNKYKCSGS